VPAKVCNIEHFGETATAVGWLTNELSLRVNDRLDWMQKLVLVILGNTSIESDDIRQAPGSVDKSC
jgi:hypothetical protein